MGKKYKVYFGGSYRENWREDYSMSVSYEGRRCVEAEYISGRWTAVGGDEELSALLEGDNCPALTELYFQAAAMSAAAVDACLQRELPLDRLWECFSDAANPLTAPELMRILMDDYGLSMQGAYQIVAQCCADIRSTGISTHDMMALQPRTAHVVGLLRQSAFSNLALIHDSRKSEYRSAFGAVGCERTLRLAFRHVGGKIKNAELHLWGEDYESKIPMEGSEGWFFATTKMPARPLALWYSFHIETEDSAHWLCPNESGYMGQLWGREVTGFRLTVYDPGFETPAWFRRSVMYQVFPDRFAFSDDGTAERGIEYHRSLGQNPELHQSIDEPVRWQPRSFEDFYSPDDFYGGTFKGIESKLPYLKSLGISCLYLNPIVEARSNHRYDTSDYHRPDPILGTMSDYERLCSQAEKSGIRIILDGVYSHTGADSRYFDRFGHYGGKGACSGKDSEFYDWYDFKSFPDEYRCWWGFKDLPEVNELNSKWQEDVVSGENSVVKLWLKAGAAGWRLDVADELPDSTLKLIRTAVKSVKPDAPIVGEVWEDAVVKESYGSRRRYALGESLDSVMNYPFRFAMLDFAHGRIDAYALRDFLTAQQMNYPKPFYYSLMNLLGSHDVDRLRSALATDVDIRSLSRDEQVKLVFDDASLDRALSLERLCATVQFSIPGVPSMYYGDEQGMCGVCDPFNRLPFKEGNRDLHDYYVSLASMRNAAPALSTGEATFMAEDRDLLLILRYITSGKDAFGLPAENGVFLAVINRSDRERTYCADCSSANMGSYNGVVSALSSEIIRLR